MCAKNQFDFIEPDSSKYSVVEWNDMSKWLHVPKQYHLWQLNKSMANVWLTGESLVEILDELILERDISANSVD